MTKKKKQLPQKPVDEKRARKMDAYIKHERFLDVAIKLYGPIRKYGSTYIVKGKYVNQGFVETFDLGTPARIRIPESRINQWQICRDNTAVCIRYAKWTPLIRREDER